MITEFWIALRATVLTLVVTGLAYPLVMTGFAQTLFPHAARGSLATDAAGKVVGSELIGQPFADPNEQVDYGSGQISRSEAIRLTKMAEKEGVQGVSVITPYFVSPNQQEIFDHYRKIAESTALPVILYNNPSTCGGLKIDVETVARLAEIPNIVGIKDSSGDLQNTNEFIRVVPDRFSVLQGRDTLIYHALLWGARGAVPATANVAPRILVDIFECFTRGDHAGAIAAQKRLNPVRLSLALGTPPGGVKQALMLMGLSIGPSRSPVNALPADKLAKMKAILQSAGLVK